jgi:hypothetical protein
MKAFIIFRDRVTYARRCLAHLHTAGFDVHVVDHDSTWPAALAWLDELEKWGWPVLRRGENAYPWDLWSWDRFCEIMWNDDRPYLVTDPDVIPSRGCPGDWPVRLEDILTRSGSVKAGLGLRLDNLPVQNRDAITEREMTFWDAQWEPGAYHANIDTTLALYRPWTEYPLFSLGPAIRTGYPYLADHLAWHETGDPSPELRHYYQRADPGHGVTGRTVKE